MKTLNILECDEVTVASAMLEPTGMPFTPSLNVTCGSIVILLSLQR